MSKKDILSRIRQRKPSSVPLPVSDFFPALSTGELLPAFMQKTEAIGGRAFVWEQKMQIDAWLNVHFPEAKLRIGVGRGEAWGNAQLSSFSQPSDLQSVDLAILEGTLGVAENGAIWVSEVQMGVRVLPFITQHLLLLLSREKLVATMHEAYQNIQVDAEGFGVFIAGPSKTADIEQSLVIGAQGPRSCTVLLDG